MRTLNVGITGNSGFIGYHLTQYLRALHSDKIEIVPFDATYFRNPDQLLGFVKQCDVIVHLAAKNRGLDDDIFATNVLLVQQLIEALEATGHTPHVILSSSTQEKKDNAYGRSKCESDRLLAAWAEHNTARYTGLIIPNVFGPFGRPFYNSVVATFCYQLTHGQEPEIKVDASLPLISVQDLIKEIFRIIQSPENCSRVCLAATAEMKVSAILTRLREFKESYFDSHIIPNLNGPFDTDLFNTFRSFIEPDHFPIFPEVHADARGYLAEILKEHSGGQVFFSVTKPGITRGNHYHLRKIERFCVIQGSATIRLRRIGTTDVIEYQVQGSRPSFVDMPIYYTHNITNSGDSDVLTLFWTNELFNPADPDTYYETV
jgi:UDP-2-acetamido-2,6-beta-L-arabino-hexul-4-ose reductase